VLYASLHQSPLYPGTGAARDVGRGAGEGFTVNLPVPAGSGRDEFLSLIRHVVAPVAAEFDPDLVAISAGYDAHAADPLASCRLDESAYAEMAAAVRDAAAAAGAPVLVCLEGGYELDALAASVVATVRALAGEGEAGDAPAEFARPYRELVSRYWSLS
jgi:acetoin utilization deacetylase AcuC-like enzyme